MIDLETYLHNAVKAERQKTLAKSDQLTLGEMILKLEPIVEKQKKRILDKRIEANVIFDFADLFPVLLESWRGIYAELALTYASYGENKPMKVSEFFEMLKNNVGVTFTGYKGGDFTMSKHTPVWVANYGNSGNTAIIEIVDNDYEIIIMTGYRES